MARSTMTTESIMIDGVRVLRLARPPVNAIDLGLVAEIEAALAAAEASGGGPLVLAGSAAYARVKAQLRAATNARLAHIVAAEDDPLLDGWL